MNPHTIEQVKFRKFRGESDIVGMLGVHEACRTVDQVNPYSVAYRVPNMSPADYSKDVALSSADGTDLNVLIAEVDGEMVGHCRLEWWREWDDRLGCERFAYLIRGWIVPEWRRRGLGSHFLEWGEARAREMDRGKAAPGELAANATDGEKDTRAFLEKAGYSIRFLSPELAYDDFSQLPAATAIPGFEISELRTDDHLAVARALVEANANPSFTAEQLEEWIEKEAGQFVEFAAGCDPAISRIAWKDGRVAGLYLCRRKDEVGDVANVAVAREFRMQGLSRSLMFHCLGAMKDQGIQRARVFTGIGADRNASPEGPYKMYLGFGFRLLTFHNRYRKALLP